jgi:DNA-binding beta-propeller fold protein YncE
MKSTTIRALGSVGLVMALAACGDNASSDGALDVRCGASGTACTWIGMVGQTGFNGDGHTPRETMLYWTMDTLFASDGTTWFIDWNNHLVRRLMPDGTIKSMVGWTDPVFPGDGDSADPTAERSAAGAPGSELQLNHPTDLYQLADGTIMLAAWHNHKLRKVDPVTGNVELIGGAGPGFKGDGALVSGALFKQPSRFAFDESENMYLIDQQNLRVRRVDAATQMITTVVGSGTQGFSGDDGPALLAQLNFKIGDNPEPSGGLVYTHDTLYISDTDNSRIRKVDLATQVITTIAGTGDPGFSGDGGPATAAQLYHPRDLEIGPEGDLYVADTDNSRVRAIDLRTNQIRTVVGTGDFGFDVEDAKPAIETKLNRPFGIDFDPSGNLYVSDTLNSRILRVAK